MTKEELRGNAVWVKITLDNGLEWDLPKDEHRIWSKEPPTSFGAGSQVRVLWEGVHYLGTVISCTFDEAAGTTRQDQLDYTIAYAACGSTQECVAHSALTLGWE